MTGRAGLRVVGRWARSSVAVSCWVAAACAASAFLAMPLRAHPAFSDPLDPSIPALNAPAVPAAPPAPKKTKTEEKLIEFAPWEEVPA